MAFDWLETQLSERAEQGYLRQRKCQQYEKDNIICINDAHYLNFSSNDYLGMRHHEGVLQAWVEGLAQFGAGSGASPLVTGHTQAHLALEAYLADALDREAVLLFNSGFSANQAICQALFAQGGDILADRLMHASFLDGASSSKAQLRRFKHNDINHLASLFEKVKSQDCLVATEGVFSMDGDSAPVREIADITSANKSWLMLDDAHGFGVLGEHGLGTAELHNLSQSDVPILMGTFGKAIGTGGAFIAGSQTLIDYLVNYARHYIYSTAMPPSQAVATLFSISHIVNNDDGRAKLHENIADFRNRFSALIGQASDSDLYLADSHSAIQPVIVGTPEKALALSEALAQRGIWVPAIRYPTVPKGEDRLRITLSATHTSKDIEILVDAIGLSLEEVVK